MRNHTENSGITNEAKWIQKLLASGNVELRCMSDDGDRKMIWAGVYDDYSALVAAIRQAEKRGCDVYNTINPIRIPATNGKLRPYRKTAKDRDVTELVTVFFDFDSIREKGVCATEEQILEAFEQASLCSIFLEDYGWKTPTVGMSGNGAHLYYSFEPGELIDLRGLYAGLDLRFSTDLVTFDISVKNPARIARCLGTTNRKSDTRSKCWHSDDVLPRDVLLKTIKALTPPKRKKPTWVNSGADKPVSGAMVKGSNVVDVMMKHGLYISQTPELHKHWVTCPWSSEHSFTGDTDTVVWDQEWPTWHCSHAHCAHRDINDVYTLLGVGKKH